MQNPIKLSENHVFRERWV